MILLDPQARPVIGHRGNRAHAPENTLASFHEAVALGVDAVEFDLRVSRDGQLVVFHDPTLERTTDGTGAVAERTVAELKQVDAGARFTPDGGRTFPWRGRGVTVSTFDELVESLPRELAFIVELKTPAATDLVKAAIGRHALAHRVIVAAFDAATTHPLRDAGVTLGACTSDVARLVLPALTRRQIGPQLFRALCVPTRWHGIPVPIASMARGLRGSGTTLHVWTINDAAQAHRLWDAGVQGIISDDPATMLAARRLRVAAPPR
jgi:glycerophosphoryl diester phosphodiesterase